MIRGAATFPLHGPPPAGGTAPTATAGPVRPAAGG